MDGTPVSSGSIATAARRARANALKAASTMWCALRAGLDPQVQRELGRARHRAHELLGQVGLEVGHAPVRERALEDA